jgi:tetratricopeptide (TPR) repeat protein
VRLFNIALAIMVLVAVAPAAHADDHGRARAAFKLGSKHYNLGEFQQALDAFREAYREYDDPSFLFNIAQCERQLGHKKEAEREYRAYLNNAPENSGNREAIKQIIAQLEKEISDEQATTKMPPTTVAPPPSAIATAPATASAPAPASAAATAATTLVARAPQPARERTPAYKKWWVWTIVGGVVVAGAATGLALGLAPKSAPSAATSLGTRSPF